MRILGFALAVLLAGCLQETGVRGQSEDGGELTGGDLSRCSQCPPGPQGPPGAPGDSAYKSGNRIKLKLQRTEDGAQKFLGWHDSHLGVDCMPLPAADGTTRCLPIPIGSVLYFADPECAEPVVSVPCSASADSSYVAVANSGESLCSTYRYRIYSVREQYSGEIFLRTESGCKSTTRSQTPNYFRGVEVPLSSFIKATDHIE